MMTVKCLQAHSVRDGQPASRCEMCGKVADQQLRMFKVRPRIVYDAAVITPREPDTLRRAADHFHARIVQLGCGNARHLRRNINPRHAAHSARKVIREQYTRPARHIQHTAPGANPRRIEDAVYFLIAAHHPCIPFRRTAVKKSYDFRSVHISPVSREKPEHLQRAFRSFHKGRIYFDSARAMARRKSR